MITQRQIDFRNEYRSRIVGWYNGYFHIVLIYAMGAAVFYIYVSHLHNVTWLEWLTVPLTFAFTNIFEWTVHKYVMHRPVNIKGLRAIYERHTLNHHQFFSDEEMRLPRRQGLARHRIPALRAGRVHLDVDPAGRRSWPRLHAECRLAVHVRHHRHVSVYEFMHFCCHVDEAGSSSTSRSSIRCGAITPRTTTRG